MTYTPDILHDAEKAFALREGLPLDGLEAVHELRAAHHDLPTPWHRIAVWIVAPVLAGFAHWLEQQTKRHEHSLFLGVMREGRLLCRLMQTLSGIPAHEIWLNRNLSMLAAFGCGDDEALVNWLVRTRLQPLTRAQAMQQLLGKSYSGTDASKPVTSDNVYALMEDWKKTGALDQARAHSFALADRLLKHWQSACKAGPQSHILLADFASAGNIQRSLVAVFAAKRHTVAMTGLNFVTTAGSQWAEKTGCLMHGWLAERGEPEWMAQTYARTPELIEIFAAAPTGPLQDYQANGTPVFGTSFLTAAQQELIRDLQKRIIDTAAVYYRQMGGELTVELGRCLWGRLHVDPKTAEVECMADWPLDAGLDGSARRVLAARVKGDPMGWTKMQTAWPAGSRMLPKEKS